MPDYKYLPQGRQGKFVPDIVIDSDILVEFKAFRPKPMQPGLEQAFASLYERLIDLPTELERVVQEDLQRMKKRRESDTRNFGFDAWAEGIE